MPSTPHDPTASPAARYDRAPSAPREVLLRRGGTAVVLHCAPDSLPEILHWGRDLGPLTGPGLRAWAAARPGIVSGNADVPPRLSLVPQQSEGWTATPGLTGSRAGLGQFSAFHRTSIEILATDGTDGAPSHVLVS